ncbi:DUF2971 domain-containing protein [Mangrovibacter phragmitis]|uniref:DUF2971 domain-containing protein n=1 Tax=Mangrovibacter phragmitis TaxID=1691903 RepID=UPI00336A1BA8
MLPEYIYKYQPLNINTITAFHSSSLWFSKIENLNDPFEKMYCFSSEFKGNSSNLLINNGAFYNTGICSFTLNSPEDEEKFKENTLMWSHYSSDFNGICLKFSLEELLGSLNSTVNRFVRGFNVNYVLSPLEIDSLTKFHDVFSILKTKHEAWANENEYRLIAESESGLMKYSPDCVKEIYLGGRMNKMHKELLLTLISATHPHLKISSVKRVPSDYRFDFDRVTL